MGYNIGGLLISDRGDGYYILKKYKGGAIRFWGDDVSKSYTPSQS